MDLVIINHPFRYETEKLLREFFPFEEINITDCVGESTPFVLTEKTENEVIVRFEDRIEKAAVSEDENDSSAEMKMARAMYKVLSEKTGYSPKWGILTGIRPSKLFLAKENELGKSGARECFSREFLVSDEKIRLAESVADREKRIIDLSRENSFSLYISIPFCPTRCSYCSFISHSTESAKKLIPEYVELLCDEIRFTGSVANELGLRLETVYYGGGTPTILSAEQLYTVGKAVEQSFDMSALREYTVEAGRPDTVTEEKLGALKNIGVTRISINPQTFNDSVLEAIGRRHTSAQTADCFSLARKMGFDNINMDIIAGLPTDTFDSFCNTLDKIRALSPENVTVHTLSIKRSSRLGGSGAFFNEAKLVEKMLESASARLSENYFPYYMYRQSKTLGNFENVGWCKDGFEGMYNIYMMEEAHTVLACGAGAVTKLKAPGSNEIERIFNYKYPFEYISKNALLAERKGRIKQFYATYNF